MSKGRAIRCYDYVNHPYDQVRHALTSDTLSVFRTATHAATDRAKAVAAALRIDIGGLQIETAISIHLRGVREDADRPETRLLIEWQSTDNPGLFPTMEAELALYPLTSSETQLDFAGTYVPPMGILGTAVDAMVGHRVADASIHSFVTDVARFLRSELDK